MANSDRLAELQLQLPAVPAPVAAYVPATVVGDQVLTSGQLPFVDGVLAYVGKAGQEVTLEEATRAAQICILNALSAAAQAAGGLDKIKRVIKLTVFVASAPDFVDQPKVANGASELLVSLFGDAGRHVRSAVGVAVLPLNAPVEIELSCQLNID